MNVLNISSNLTFPQAVFYISSYGVPVFVDFVGVFVVLVQGFAESLNLDAQTVPYNMED